MKCKETEHVNILTQNIMHHHSHTEHHNLLYEYPCAVQQEIQLRMLSKLTVGAHTTYRPAKISLILFVLAVTACVIGLILREFGVRKHVLIEGCNFFDNGLIFNALQLLPNIIDTNDTTGAVYSTSNFINLRTTVTLNSSITFDLTAVLAAIVATTIRIKNKDIFDRETQSLHITPQPAFVFNNIDNGLRQSGAAGYVHDVILHGILDGIAFDWVVDKKFECHVNEKLYFNNGMCIFASLRNFSVARRECFVCFTLCQCVYFVS